MSKSRFSLSISTNREKKGKRKYSFFYFDQSFSRCRKTNYRHRFGLLMLINRWIKDEEWMLKEIRSIWLSWRSIERRFRREANIVRCAKLQNCVRPSVRAFSLSLSLNCWKEKCLKNKRKRTRVDIWYQRLCFDGDRSTERKRKLVADVEAFFFGAFDLFD